MNPPQVPAQPDTSQNPMLITEVPGYKKQEDASPTTAQVAAQIHSIDPEKREAAAQEINARRDAHENFLNNQPGIKALKEASEPIEIGDHVAFAKTDDGAIESPLRFPFRDYHLPPAPDWVEPLAVVLTGNSGGQELRSAMLVFRRQGAIEKLFLEDAHLRADTTNPKWEWLVAGSAGLSSESYKMVKTDENNDLVTLQLDWDGYGGEQPPENIRIVRGDLSEREKAFMDVKAVEKQRRILSGIGKVAATVGLAAGLMNMIPEDNSKPEKTAIETLAEMPSMQEAVRRVEANIEAYKAGDIETLQRNFEHTDFAKPLIDHAVFERITQAKSLDDLASIVDGELGQYDINFRFMRESLPGEYHAITDEQLEAARETTLGILDGFNNLRAIGVNYAPYDIEVTGDLFSERDAQIVDVGGKYFESWAGSKPLIQISATKRSWAADSFEHENGHHSLRTLESAIKNLNPDGGEYQRDSYGNKIGDGNLVPGRDVASEYGGTSRAEDTAELLATSTGQYIGIDLDKENVLQEKYLRVIIELENREPGAAAFIFHNALTYDKSIEERLDESAVRSVYDTLRENASHALLLAGLTLAVGSGLARENQTLVDRQIRAGLRPRRIYKQPRRARRRAQLKKP